MKNKKIIFLGCMAAFFLTAVFLHLYRKKSDLIVQNKSLQEKIDAAQIKKDEIILEAEKSILDVDENHDRIYQKIEDAFFEFLAVRNKNNLSLASYSFFERKGKTIVSMEVSILKNQEGKFFEILYKNNRQFKILNISLSADGIKKLCSIEMEFLKEALDLSKFENFVFKNFLDEKKSSMQTIAANQKKSLSENQNVPFEKSLKQNFEDDKILVGSFKTSEGNILYYESKDGKLYRMIQKQE